MERFNGIALEDIAPVTISGVYVEPPKIKPKWEDRPVDSGAHFIRTRYETRTIEISFYLPVVDAVERAEYIAAINAWAHSSEPKQLETSKRPGKYIMAVLSELPSPSAGEWWEKLIIKFEAGEPFFYDSGLTAVPIGTSFEINNVYGAVDAYIEWANPSTASSPAWVLDGITTITISGSVAAGAVELYVNPIAATLAGTSVMDQVTIASRPFDLTYGAHIITGNGTLFYRERCL
jgi:phage-related protein